MPNWCANWLDVEAPAGDAAGARQLAAFRRKLLSGERRGTLSTGRLLDLGAVVPLPPELRGGRLLPSLADSALQQRMSDWCVRHWGCDSALFEVKISEDSAAALRLTANTRWSPPAAWVVAASAQYPLLTFKLLLGEQGMDFGGRLVAKGGAEAEHVETTYFQFVAFLLHEGGEAAAEEAADIAIAFLQWGRGGGAPSADAPAGAEAPSAGHDAGASERAADDATLAALKEAISEACGRWLSAMAIEGAPSAFLPRLEDAPRVPLGAALAALKAATPAAVAAAAAATDAAGELRPAAALATARDAGGAADIAAGLILARLLAPFEGDAAIEDPDPLLAELWARAQTIIAAKRA
jgi:hypothetical protein